MILLDTNVLSELMRIKPEQSIILWMDSFDYKELGITSITVAEILYGIGLLPAGHKKQRLIEAARMLFEQDFNHRIFSFDQLAAVEYADIVLRHDKLGKPISMPDAQIASICRVFEYSLATRNIKDFENVSVTLINPWEA